jgi:integrase
MASIRERHPGVWQIRVFTGRNDEGEPTQVAVTVYGTKRDALKEAARLESAPHRGAAGRTVGDVLHEWFHFKEGSYTPSSYRDQESRVRQIETDQIVTMSVARLGVADIDRWIVRMRRAGVGASSIHNRHAVLRAALQQAVVWGWITSNPAALARARRPRQPPRGAMTPEEVIAAIAAATDIDPMAGLALRIAAVAGARRAEIAALRWADLRGSTLTVDSSAHVLREGGPPKVVDARTKTAERHTVTLDRETVRLWRELQAEREDLGPYLFGFGMDPPNPDRIGWWWHRARGAAGIDPKWRLHDLRHFAATVAIGAGHDIRTVAHRLGHADPAMTLRVYAHALEAADEAVAASLGDILDGPPS